MKQKSISITIRKLRNSLLAVLTVAAVTLPLFLVGRKTLGEGVIALLYLVPVTWSASRWGLIPGISAALAATLCFDFLFIPPFFTFTIGSLEGWLVLAIFLGVAVIVVERIQASLSKARETLFMYEMSSALANLRTAEAVAQTVARQIQQLFQAALVNVIYQPGERLPGVIASVPENVSSQDRPDRILPLLNSWGMAGVIQVWHGPILELPSEDSRILKDFARQAAQAFERTLPQPATDHQPGMASKSFIR